MPIEIPMFKFRYTLDNGRLTLRQRIFYEKNGYLMFRGLIPQSDLDRYHKRFDDIAANKVSHHGITMMYDVKDRKSLNKLQDIQYDPVFCEYLKHEKILDIVEGFTGPNIQLIHNMLIAKPPDIGYGSSRHPPHQDLYYFPLKPADRIVAAWTAMERCDEENGCLYVAIGSHHLGRIFPHQYPSGAVNKFYHGIQDLPPTLTWMNLVMEPGDTVFFHPLIIHGSGVNKSTRTRRAISGHYASGDIVISEEDMDSAQRTIQKEILEFTEKKYPGINISYNDIWNFKTMLVRGIKSNM